MGREYGGPAALTTGVARVVAATDRYDNLSVTAARRLQDLGMSLDLTLHQRPALELRPSAELVAYAQMLAATTTELERMIDRELRDNPALERADDAFAVPPAAAGAPTTALPATPRDVPDEVGLLVRIGVDARAELPACDHAILEFVLGSVDDRGFLPLDATEVAGLLGVADDRVARVIDVVRALGPAGFARRDVRDYLAAQLDTLDADPRLADVARQLLSGSLADLAAGRYAALARRLGVDRQLVIAARDLIRARLRPFPVLDATLRGARHEADGMPEVIITIAEPGGLRVELIEEQRLDLCVNPIYAALDALDVADDDRRAMAAQARGARTFVRRLHERWATTRRVLEHTARAQRGFILHGAAELVPLTQAEVAAAVGLHESTVSRAVSRRSALLPCGRVVACKDFFTPSLSVREALRSLVVHEPRPLSDDELAARLTAAGHPIARRTVAKYRGLLDIPSAARR